ncbi:beta-lactamase class A [Actinacidiphila alni]|uniref:Beta-lactamase class A n=1 Tax=Actinacidiphila alni TaxID=380248 RepID=A0A1I2H1Y1_9ACTN|nr:serine hydrolase [Actinacidiphila alni]SFF23269.1 beta-lactamase class A [Actinacidiphila alni]
MTEIQDRLGSAFADAGVSGVLHARTLRPSPGAAGPPDPSGEAPFPEIGYEPDQLVCTASVHKVCVLLTAHRLAAEGRLRLTERIDCRAAGRTVGSTGLSAMLDDVRMSARDLAYLMMAVSDNAAADLLLERVGLDEVNRTTRLLGLERTLAVENFAAAQAGMRDDAGPAGAGALADPAVVSRLRALDPARSNRSTPRELTRLLGALWHDELCSPEHGEAMRRLMSLQVWPHRLASGFPFDDVGLAGKTGTLPTLRAEVGVVEYPDGGRYAVAVFTRAADTAHVLPAADSVIGTAARIAVDALRAPVRATVRRVR